MVTDTATDRPADRFARATSSPAVPRVARPRWLDLRLVGGVLLVLVSVVIGVHVVASADNSAPVWIAAHDLAAGQQLSAADLRLGRVHFSDGDARYVSASGAAPVGYVLTRPVSAGELLPRAAISDPHSARPTRLVTVPVDGMHLPPRLAAGDRVDVYVTPHATVGRSGAAHIVLSDVLVADVADGQGEFGGDTTTVGVVLSVAPTAAGTLVTAMHAGDVDLALVPPTGS